MGYAKIPNLEKDQTILMFKECYALEKIHGTSAHIKYKDGNLSFFSGGCVHKNFVSIFDKEALENYAKKRSGDFVIYGEAYGGKINGGSKTYCKDIKFVVFDVKVGDCWLSVPDAYEVSKSMGLDFVMFWRCPTNIDYLNMRRDCNSVQAYKNGMGSDKMSEGVVLRPIVEMTTNSGRRICAKYKRAEFCERKTKQEVTPERMKVLSDANDIAEEWVTMNRLDNILSHIEKKPEISDIRDIIKLMVQDVETEAKDEIVESREARKAISRLAAKLFKEKLTIDLEIGD